MPVEIASYLLNEKRRAIHSIEKRHDVDVIVVPNEAMETPHFGVFRVREGEEVHELSYNLVKLHQEKDEHFVPEESLVSRNIETAAVTSENVLESAAVSMAIPAPAPVPEKKVENKPSLLTRILAKLKAIFADKPVVEEKSKGNRPKSNRNRRQQERRNQRRSRAENVERDSNTKRQDEVVEEVIRPRSERNTKRSRKANHAVDTVSVAENTLDTATVETVEVEKVESVAPRRQRRDLRKKVRISDDTHETALRLVATETSMSEAETVVEETVVVTEFVPETVPIVEEGETEKRRDNNRRRLPRHLRVNNQRRRRQNQEFKAPMPLLAAVASPELASGKVWPDFQPVVVVVVKENQFLSVDELLEQQHQPKESAATIPALDLVAEGSEKGVSPFNGFVVQPANESVEKKVKQSLQRLEEEQALAIMQPLSVADTKIGEVEEETEHKPLNDISTELRVKEVDENRLPQSLAEEVVEQAEMPAQGDEVKSISCLQRNYQFNGRLGTISAVPHTTSEMTLAKASDEPLEMYQIGVWTESRYYFHGKGSAGHHSAISHVYAGPTKAENKGE